MAAKPKLVEEAVRVPALHEAHDELRALKERNQRVSVELGENRRAQITLEADLKKNPPVRAVRAGLADILGDTVAVDNRPAELSELRKREADLEEGERILSQRMRDLRGPASAKACEIIKPEFSRRAAALALALEAAHAARVSFESLLDDMESEDITSTLGLDRPGWMGDREDGHIQRFVRKAKELKYV
ncbi:MAG: hypothetical protein JSR78_16225 [Proteobacteria bacterium]|nr:hypothetical protein [Pseudomonadota bacterium]